MKRTNNRDGYEPLLYDKKEFYNAFFQHHGLPNSDYCFSVIQTWLAYGGTVFFKQLTPQLLALRYIDVLDDIPTTEITTLIGAASDITQEHVADLIRWRTESSDNKIIVTESHYSTINSLTPECYRITEDEGLHDYIYSVDGYASLDGPEYRRIRREYSIFQRQYPGALIELNKSDITDTLNKVRLINIHHAWDDTFQYDNDPERTEGLVVDRMLRLSEYLGVECVEIVVDDSVEGLIIYTRVDMDGKTYADVHHARFSYKHRYLNDITFHLLAAKLQIEGYHYINFERDAGIPGLRHHKKMLKPVLTIKGYNLEKQD